MSLDTICNTNNSKLEGLVGKIDSMLNIVSGPIDEINSKLESIGDEATTTTDDITNSINNRQEEINGTMNSSIEDLDDTTRNIVECLGGDVKKAMGLDIANVANKTNTLLDSAIDSIVSTSQIEVANLIEQVENNISTEVIDEALQLAQCLAECPGGASYSLVDIEDKINSYKITTNGELNMAVLNGTSEVKNATKTVKDAKKTAKETIKKSIKDSLI
mgnify:CR=1 FL=1